MQSRRLLAAAVAAASLFAACGPADEPAASAEAISGRAVDPGNAGGNKFVTVMSRNLFVGGDILAPLLAPDAESALAAAAQVWADVQASDFPLRAQRIADEIAAARPDVVGLQEVFWFVETSLADGAVTKEIDFLSELLDALLARGLEYRAVATASHTNITIPFTTLGFAVTLQDRDAILARVNVKAEEPFGTSFDDPGTRIEASIGGVLPVTVTRGFASVEVKHQGLELLFVNSHLEVAGIPGVGPLVQFAQANELLSLIGPAERTILVGDFNSNADVPTVPVWTYPLLTAAYRDAWLTFEAPGSGFTCCFEPLSDPAAELVERIDLVLYKGFLTPKAVSRAGVMPEDLGNGSFWGSDHAGVVATFRLELERFAELTP